MQTNYDSLEVTLKEKSMELESLKLETEREVPYLINGKTNYKKR